MFDLTLMSNWVSLNCCCQNLIFLIFYSVFFDETFNLNYLHFYVTKKKWDSMYFQFNVLDDIPNEIGKNLTFIPYYKIVTD